MEVVAEILDVADGGFGNGGVDEMAREQDKGNISNVLGLCQVRQMAEFKRWVTGGVENLRSALDGR